MLRSISIALFCIGALIVCFACQFVALYCAFMFDSSPSLESFGAMVAFMSSGFLSLYCIKCVLDNELERDLARYRVEWLRAHQTR